MSDQNTKALHWILGASLLLIAVFVVVALVAMGSKAVSVTTTTGTITNAAPTVTSVFISDTTYGGSDDYSGGTLTPTAGGTKSIYINGVVTDTNGDDDIDSVSATFYRSGVGSGSSCSPDNNDCYRNIACATQANDATSLQYDCPLTLQYFMDSTDATGEYSAQNWLVYVEVEDLAEDSGTDNSVNKEVAGTVSVNIPTSVTYPALALDASTTTANDVEHTITQLGNDRADLLVSSSAAMNCSIDGTIPIANQEWSLSSFNFGSGTDLTNSAADTSFNINYRTDDETAMTQILYWGIHIPATGVGGTCSGTTTITAEAS